MWVQRTSVWLATVCLCLLLASVALPSGALAAAPSQDLQCTQTASGSTPMAPSAGHPCWVDWSASDMPYPFGSDGNPADPTSHFCAGDQNNIYGPGADGPLWAGDFQASGDAIPGEVPCYQQVESMSFRAWNRGLAVASPVSNVGNV